VRVDVCLPPAVAGAIQATVVLELHDEVRHSSAAREADTVLSITAKLSPETVVNDRPEVGPLYRITLDVTGLSNVNTKGNVPAIDEMLMTKSCFTPLIPPMLGRHDADVVDDQLTVEHRDTPILTEAVGSIGPKFMPVSVTVDPTDNAALSS
jgi:hypothetical protein